MDKVWKPTRKIRALLSLNTLHSKTFRFTLASGVSLQVLFLLWGSKILTPSQPVLFGLFQPTFSCLTNSVTHQAIVLRAVQTLKTQQVFDSAMKKNFFGFRFFVSDFISGIVLGLFGPLPLALGPNH